MNEQSTDDSCHPCRGTQSNGAGIITSKEGGGQMSGDTQSSCATDLDLICDNLRELHRQRQDLHRSEKSMTLRIKAKCRRICGNDKKEAAVLYRSMFNGCGHEHAFAALTVCQPFTMARRLLETERAKTEKIMALEAKKLPVIAMVEETLGFGIGSLAALIGECGNLSNYSTVSKLWKRLGLAVINGERQRKCSNAEKAIEHGYNPSRRAVMWNVGQCLLKCQSQRLDKETGEILKPAGEYRVIFDDRKAIELDRVETKSHAQNRATRYMEKAFVCNLWITWRDSLKVE